MGLLDSISRLVPAGKGDYALSEEERRQIATQGLLQAGLGILANNRGPNASANLGAGLLGGFQGMQTQAQQMQENRYKQTRAQRGLDDPAGIREFNETLRLAGIDPSSKEAQQAARIRLGMEGRASGAGYGFGEQVDAMGVPRPRRENPRDGSMQVFYSETGQWVPLGQEGPQTLPQAVPDPGSAPFGDVVGAMVGQESGGDPNAVSPAGARGLTQVMPATGQDPGFGVEPLQNQTPDENLRFGGEYLDVLIRRYGGNRSLGLAAYNAGPGAVDAALEKAGGDPAKAIASLSRETRAYVPGVQRRLGQGRSKEAEAAAVKQAEQQVELDYLPGRGRIEAEAAGAAELAKSTAKAGVEREFAAPAAQKSADYAVRQSGLMIEQAQRVLDHPGLNAAVGFGGRQLSTVPGSDAANAAADIANLKNQIFISTLGAMREASKTGGAVGNVSNLEGARFENAMVALDQSQSAPQFKERLQDLIRIAGEAQESIRAAYEREFGGAQASPSQSPTDQPRRIRIKL